MDLKGYQQYKEQSIATMTQEELLLLLYDELVKRLVQAELALDKKEIRCLRHLCSAVLRL